MRFSRAAASIIAIILLAFGMASAQTGVRISSPTTANGGAFIHTARSIGPDSNISGNITRLVSEYPVANISPLTDGTSNTIMFATYNVTASSGTQQIPFGTYMEDDGIWYLFNQANVSINHGAAFNVQVQGKSDSVFIHTAKVANIEGHVTTLNHPLLNDNPTASFSVMPLWKGVYNNHYIGVYYVDGRWTIFNQDIALMPVGAKFNIHVLLNPETDFQHIAAPANIFSTNKTEINHPLLNNNVSAQFIVTQNWTLGGTYNDNPIGVEYDSGTNRWRIINVNGAAMTSGAGFNIHITHNGDSYNDGAVYNGGFEAPAADSLSNAIKWNSTAAGLGSKRVCNQYAPVSASTKLFANTGECAFLLKGAVGEVRKLIGVGFYDSDPADNIVDLYMMLKKNGTGSLTVKAKVTLADATKITLTVSGTETNGAYDWKPVGTEQLLPPGIAPVKVKIVITLTGGGKVYIDDVSSASYIGAFR